MMMFFLHLPVQQVIFSDSVCRDCGEKVGGRGKRFLKICTQMKAGFSLHCNCQGDSRLMSEFCHMERQVRSGEEIKNTRKVASRLFGGENVLGKA